MANEMEDLKSMIGVTIPLKVGTRVVELQPVRIKDWPVFSDCYGVLSINNLQTIFSFEDGPRMLGECLEVVTRKDLEELQPMMEEMTQADYSEFKQIVIAQNELDFRKDEGEKEPKKE